MAEKNVQASAAFDKVMAARDANKLTAIDFIANMFGDRFIELHGDRRYSDDKAIIAGLGMLYDMPVTVIGIERSRRKSSTVRCSVWSTPAERTPVSARRSAVRVRLLPKT